MVRLNRLVDRDLIVKRWKSTLTYLQRTRPPVNDADMREAHQAMEDSHDT